MKVRRIYREDREASITPELVRKLLIVAAHKGFMKAQRSIQQGRTEVVKVHPGESRLLADGVTTVSNGYGLTVHVRDWTELLA